MEESAAPFACPDLPSETLLSIIILGASGDLAKKKTYPALFTLWRERYIPPTFHIFGYARTPLSNQAFRDRIRPFLLDTPGPLLSTSIDSDVDTFLSHCTFIAGPYEDLNALVPHLASFEASVHCAPNPTCPVGRLFYLALPPSVYPVIATAIRVQCSTRQLIPIKPPPNAPLPPFEDALVDQDGVPLAPPTVCGCPAFWVRVIVEKPFGRDLASSDALASHLGALFPERSLMRMDQFNGKTMAQNMLVLRFANQLLEPTWNRFYIQSVQFVLKESIGTMGRGGYFDESGIIRDVVQNHLMQLLALVAMDRPVSTSPEDIRAEKLRVLRCIAPVTAADTVLGQYTASGNNPGYTDDPTVPKDSQQSTFACCVLRINNPRWEGVPFIMRAGKAMDDRKVEIRVQYKSVPALIFPHQSETTRNELVMRVQPNEAIYMKVMVKEPGLHMRTVMSELDLSFFKRFTVRAPDAYERLLLDALRGNTEHYVDRSMLHESWRIFDDLLQKCDRGEMKPIKYAFGTRGPVEAEELLKREGYVRSAEYAYPGGVAGGV